MDTLDTILVISICSIVVCAIGGFFYSLTKSLPKDLPTTQTPLL